MKKAHKIIFVIAAVLALVSWVVAAYCWGKLPDIIPVHFGISGQADGWAEKSLFYVFLIPFLQTIMLSGFVFLYYKPQYSDIPTTMWLVALDKKHREHAFNLIRTMLAGIALWIGLLFTYITYGMNVSALDDSVGLSSPVMVMLVVLMVLWLIVWTIKVYRATKAAVASFKNKEV
jgi:uncharacterized membrane protein